MINEINFIIQQQMKGISIPKLILLSICACIIFLMIYIFRKYIMRKEGSFKALVLFLVFSIYVYVLIYITLGNRELGSRDDARWIPFLNIFLENGELNIFGFVLMILNIILFIPYGFLLTLIQIKIKTLHRFFLVFTESLLLSILIEVVQRITKLGYFEVEDIICNTFGGVIGYFMASTLIFFYHLHQEKTRISLDF